MSPARYSSVFTLLFAAAVATSVGATDALQAPSTVVASQGGVSITLDDIDAFAAGIPDERRAGFFNSPSRIENLLSQLLVQKQLAAEARAIGLDKDAKVQRQIALATEDALSKARMLKFRDELKIPDFNQLAQEEFIAHKETYIEHGRIDVKHVLIGTKTRSDADAKALAETVLKEATAHPDQFDALIEKYSDDPSKMQNHGVMADAGDKKYVREFSAAANALKKPGELSPLVKTDFGYHVLQLIARTPDRKPAFAEVKDQIVAKLRSDYVEKQLKAHGDELRNRPLDANAELVGSLRGRYGVATEAEPTPAK
jgi:peptidyl-prolyl cis-trans isomerase C